MSNYNKKFFIHQITLYHLNDDAAVRQQYESVYFRHYVGMRQFTKGMVTESTGTVTIPTTEQLNVSKGDYLVEGLVEDDYDLRELTEKYVVYKVVNIHDNRKGKLQHYRLDVKD